MTRHAEIAGAGFAGLAAACFLADAGWSVRVHEKAEEPRTIGAGIYMSHNGLLALQAIGVYDELAARGSRIAGRRVMDERGAVFADWPTHGADRLYVFRRRDLLDALLRAALERGVELRTRSGVASVTETPGIVDAGGVEWPAGLVVGADGVASTVATSLGLVRERRRLPTISLRFLLDGHPFGDDRFAREYWSGRRRVSYTACGPHHTYVYTACSEADESGGRLPLDVDSWTRHFPQLQELFERLALSEAYRTNYAWVHCSAWSRGAVAIAGDAAHAQPPTLGQAANLAFANAQSLASFLNAFDEVPTALREWEAAVRPTAERAQRWATYYNNVTNLWPERAFAVRKAMIRAFGHSSFLRRALNQAARQPAPMPRG